MAEMSDPLARVAELEAENEELRARIEAAERSQAGATSSQADNAALLRRLEEAKRDGLALQERRELIEQRVMLSDWKLLVLALVLGMFLGIVQALGGHR